MQLDNMKRSTYDNMPSFGRKLMELRLSRKLRQEDLALELDVSRPTISYYESRAKNPTMEFVQKVSAFFGVTTDELLNDDIKSKSKKRGILNVVLGELDFVSV